MDEACNLKLQELKITQRQQQKQIDQGKVNQTKIWHSLRQINTTMTQVKYAVYGAAAVVVLKSIGVLETLKLFLFA